MIATKPLPFDPRRKPKPQRLPVRKVVTIAAGFQFDDGILLCADTKIATNIKTTESKIFACEYSDGRFYSVFCVACNNFDLAKGAIRQCEEALAGIEIATATLKLVRDTIEAVLTEFYRVHVLPRPPEESVFELLIGVLLHGRVQMYYSSCTEVLNEVNNYRCIGSGGYLADYLLKRCGSYTPMTRDEAGLLASYILERVKDHDEAVGGEIEFFVIQPHEIGSYFPPAYPTETFADQLGRLSWDMLRKLYQVENREPIERDMIIEDYCDEIRKLARSDRHWFDYVKKLKSEDSEH